MATKYDVLIKFAKDTKDINPHLLSDVESGLIKPCKILDESIEMFYNERA